MNNPLISILVPCYNVSPWLHRCLDSILAQTDTNWEAILVNDGSKDNTADILEEYAKIGVEYFTFHQETVPHMHRLIQHIKQCGMKAGVALNPSTPVSVLEDVAADLDMILIMSVNPGFGGQSFIKNAIKKVKQAKKLLEEVDNTTAVIEVDGGINDITCVPIKRVGATVLVAGSAVFGAEDRAHMIEAIRNN